MNALRSEFLGGPWDGENYPPDAWDRRWRLVLLSDGIRSVTVLGDNGLPIGRYRSASEEPYAWHWIPAEEEEHQHGR